ncbi:unnamed protein product [Lepeophtheirus salmonis]|uniref:(salmon louse) hypothetical protein n=1 Tax=Lepeophtheirus salmonis TaxID=72036 RepID=A0A7R8HBF8_LEPSM|nr:unnamed protein product [Lepeophtheirus salmonis]CAF2985076.1 unnamed protein product [Lepeophtheirus salmonis]
MIHGTDFNVSSLSLSLRLFAEKREELEYKEEDKEREKEKKRGRHSFLGRPTWLYFISPFQKRSYSLRLETRRIKQILKRVELKFSRASSMKMNNNATTELQKEKNGRNNIKEQQGPTMEWLLEPGRFKNEA